MTHALQENKYISGYHGIFRDIMFDSASCRVLIRFNAFLNDELDFEYAKVYQTEKEALKEVEEFIKSDSNHEYELPYTEESIKKINISIDEFMKAIIDDNVSLPNQDYEYQGYKNGLKAYIRKKH